MLEPSEWPVVACAAEFNGGSRFAWGAGTRRICPNRGKIAGALGKTDGKRSEDICAAVQVAERAANPEWLSNATQVLSKYWRRKNQRKDGAKLSRARALQTQLI